jgi:hypothetical protein
LQTLSRKVLPPPHAALTVTATTHRPTHLWTATGTGKLSRSRRYYVLGEEPLKLLLLAVVLLLLGDYYTAAARRLRSAVPPLFTADILMQSW